MTGYKQGAVLFHLRREPKGEDKRREGRTVKETRQSTQPQAEKEGLIASVLTRRARDTSERNNHRYIDSAQTSGQASDAMKGADALEALDDGKEDDDSEDEDEEQRNQPL